MKTRRKYEGVPGVGRAQGLAPCAMPLRLTPLFQSRQLLSALSVSLFHYVGHFSSQLLDPKESENEESAQLRTLEMELEPRLHAAWIKNPGTPL